MNSQNRTRALPSRLRRRAVALALPLVALAVGACLYHARATYTQDAGARQFTGQWLVEFRTGDDKVSLTLNYHYKRINRDAAGEWDGYSNTTRSVPAGDLQGLTRAQAMSSTGGQVSFRIVRDAGTLNCEGWFREGNGSGHFTFAPSASFASELQRRGMGAPTAQQQFEMTMADASLASLDELRAQGYEQPTLDEFVRTATHGVSLEYLRGLKSAGYKLSSVEQLIRMRDHGVTLAFINELNPLGYARLDA
ncbi:MAG: hypothetical protein LC746_11130, partial [Acidobacteria bacterium]|nr:hypothetical protein [Acidobacteriota bacterium]